MLSCAILCFEMVLFIELCIVKRRIIGLATIELTTTQITTAITITVHDQVYSIASNIDLLDIHCIGEVIEWVY